MTIDDDNSVYVGGIPYDATEESLRRVFDLYGKIVAIKIVNDRDIGGKCYAFVTYTNPRSAIDAITEMDGASIDGRMVRVNEVKTRGGRPNFNREGFRRGMGRGTDWQRDRIRERDQHHERPKHWDRDRDHDRGYSRSRDYRQDRERGHHGQEQTRDHFSDQDRDEFRSMDDYEQNYHQSREEDGDHILNENQDGELDGTSTHDNEPEDNKDQPLKKRNRSSYSGGHSREQLSESSGDHHDQEAVEQLDRSIHKRAELKNEISLMEDKLKERQQLIHDLQRKSQKLEDSLTAKKKLVSHRQIQLTKLHKCFMQIKEYNEKLKNSENELQILVDSVMVEVSNDKDVLRDDAGFANLSA
uniref:RRM domain-containing protein n=1 Tax=Kalanchoe fedtschenkoi TaxID=63787 RepID=A0A7N0T8B5_KALFE